MMMKMGTSLNTIFGEMWMRKMIKKMGKRMGKVRTLNPRKLLRGRPHDPDPAVDMAVRDRRMRRNGLGDRGQRALRVVRVPHGPEAAAERRVEKAGSQEGAHPAPPPVGPGLAVSGTRKALDPKRAQEEVARPRGREEEGEGKETDPPPQAAANGQGF